MYNLYPPFAEFGITLLHTLNILLRIFGLYQGQNNIFNYKPPLIIMDRLSDFFSSKYRYMRFHLAPLVMCSNLFLPHLPQHGVDLFNIKFFRVETAAVIFHFPCITFPMQAPFALRAAVIRPYSCMINVLLLYYTGGP